MSIRKATLVLCGLLSAPMVGNTQVVNVNPQVRTKATADGKVTIVEIAAHFVTAIRMPEAVSSVVVGAPTLFLAEHNEHKPDLAGSANRQRLCTTEQSLTTVRCFSVSGRTLPVRRSR